MAQYAEANKTFASKLNETGTSAILGISKMAAGFNAAKMAIDLLITSIMGSLKKVFRLCKQVRSFGCFWKSITEECNDSLWHDWK